MLGRTDVEVWVELGELSVGKVSKGTKGKSVLVELGLIGQHIENLNNKSVHCFEHSNAGPKTPK